MDSFDYSVTSNIGRLQTPSKAALHRLGLKVLTCHRRMRLWDVVLGVKQLNVCGRYLLAIFRIQTYGFDRSSEKRIKSLQNSSVNTSSNHIQAFWKRLWTRCIQLLDHTSNTIQRGLISRWPPAFSIRQSFLFFSPQSVL